MIEVGDAIPSAKVRLVNKDGIVEADSADLFASGHHVIFALPGAFTATCSSDHLPGYLELADELRANGVDKIVCLSVNDQHVMKAWGESYGALAIVDFLADGNAELTKAMGIEKDISAGGLGLRAQRSAFVIKDGIVQAAFTENKPGVVTSSGAPAIVEFLKSRAS